MKKINKSKLLLLTIGIILLSFVGVISIYFFVIGIKIKSEEFSIEKLSIRYKAGHTIESDQEFELISASCIEIVKNIIENHRWTASFHTYAPYYRLANEKVKIDIGGTIVVINYKASSTMRQFVTKISLQERDELIKLCSVRKEE